MAKAKAEPAWRTALKAARPFIVDAVIGEIVNYSSPERHRRNRATIEQRGYFFHEDTITDIHPIKAIKEYRRVLKKIDAALVPQKRKGK